METWPSNLPQTVLIAGDNPQEYLNGLDNPESEHNYSVNRIRTNPEKKVTVSFVCNWLQWRSFYTFYRTTTNEGCVAFQADWFADLGYNNHFARIMPAPNATRKSGGAFVVTMVLELTTMANANGVWTFPS